MKVSIITLHAVGNYGSVLQTYATQQVFRDFGYDIEVVNYIRKALQTDTIAKILRNSEYGLFMKIKLLLVLPSGKKMRKVFPSFLNEHIQLSDRCYCTEDDFKEYPIEADIYCTGSDQVWNTGWHHEIPKPFFLTYAPDNSRRISFSASFGKDILDEWEKPEIKKLLERYDYISVRESSAVDILNDLGISNCEHVLDPTLTVQPKIWYDMAKKRIVNEKYILIYQLNNNKQFDRYAKELAKRKKLKLIRLCTRYDQLRKTGHGIVLPQVEEFLSLFRDAEYILTDSFHATAFSLIFHKRFIDIYPGLYNTRLESILQLVGLQERHLTDYSNFTLIDKPIDYIYVDKVIDRERVKTLNYLEQALMFG